MKDKDLLEQMKELQNKLSRAQRQAAALKEKGKYLEMQYDDSRTREQRTNDLVMELLERQRELNVMLNRANIMLNRTQEAMALTSMEFNEMAKALPEPKKVEWADRVSKINDLFKKTGIQDAEVTDFSASNTPALSTSFDRDELKRESEEAFGRKEFIWNREKSYEPPRVEAEVVVEDPEQPAEIETSSAVSDIIDHQPEPVREPVVELSSIDEREDTDDDVLEQTQPRKKSWWQRIAG